jgi:hypothetical protein
LSRISLAIQPSRLPRKGERIIGDADAAQLAALANDLRVTTVSAFGWELLVKPWGKGGFLLKGVVRGEVEQPCVVTLVPVAGLINEDVDLRFQPEAAVRPRRTQSAAAMAEDVAFDAGPEDEPELFAGDSVDIGSFLEEHLALGIDPYPRAPDARLDDASLEQPIAKTTPFAQALRDWSAKKRD